MANVVKTSSLYRFLSHKRKVKALYKKSLRHLEAWCVNLGPGEFCYERTLLRARFDQNKDIQDETKSAQVLRLGEEEFWESQHVMPPVFTNSPYGGVMYERFDKYRPAPVVKEMDLLRQIAEFYTDLWANEEKAMFPDFLARKEEWYTVREKVWPEEMKELEEWDKKNVEKGVPMSDKLPAAKAADGYPPFWWRTVTRPLMRPSRMKWYPRTGQVY